MGAAGLTKERTDNIVCAALHRELQRSSELADTFSWESQPPRFSFLPLCRYCRRYAYYLSSTISGSSFQRFSSAENGTSRERNIPVSSKGTQDVLWNVLDRTLICHKVSRLGASGLNDCQSIFDTASTSILSLSSSTTTDCYFFCRSFFDFN